MTLEIAAKTNKGMVREANEDNFIVTQDCTKSDWIVPKEPYQNSDAGTILVVADGMGGLNAGEVASKIAVDSVREDLINLGANSIDNKNIKQQLTNIIINAHKKIASRGKTDPQTEGMGSTIVMAWIKDLKAHIGWVGDSRCYIYRNGKLQQLSKDHSYVQTLIDKGELTREQAFLHPENNIITQSLGDAELTPTPGYVTFPLTNNDQLLLCSDGLNAMLQDEAIEKIINENNNLTDSVQQLIHEANIEGGHDNITVLMARVVNGASDNMIYEQNGETANSHTTLQLLPGKKKSGINRMLLYATGLAATAVVVYMVTTFQKPHPIFPVPPAVTGKDKDGMPDSVNKIKPAPVSKPPGKPNENSKEPGEINKTDDKTSNKNQNKNTQKISTQINEGLLNPLLDSDNDGVKDNDDSCKTKAGPVSNHGCPPDSGDTKEKASNNKHIEPTPGNTPLPLEPTKNILQEKKQPITNLNDDEDNDGVINQEDECAGTMPGVAVDAKGCSVKQNKEKKKKEGHNTPAKTAIK